MSVMSELSWFFTEGQELVGIPCSFGSVGSAQGSAWESAQRKHTELSKHQDRSRFIKAKLAKLSRKTQGLLAARFAPLRPYLKHAALAYGELAGVVLWNTSEREFELVLRDSRMALAKDAKALRRVEERRAKAAIQTARAIKQYSTTQHE